MKAESRLTPHHSSKNPASDSAMPKTSAARGVMRPAGSGRRSVRRMCRSASRSYHWFSVAVPEASSPVPISVCSSAGHWILANQGAGRPK